MKVLIACEESQRVCIAFREKGHETYSCDIQKCSGGFPEWHILSDCIPLLNGNCKFTTQNGDVHYIDKWDMIIAHPPCTYLCNTAQRWLHYGSEEYRQNRINERNKAIEFFMLFVNADCEKIVIENPVGIMSNIYRKPDCIYNPYDFEGETECKKTALWLKGVKPLLPNQNLPKELRTHNLFKSHWDDKIIAWNDKQVAVLRSKTPVGVAKAMAEQWG